MTPQHRASLSVHHVRKTINQWFQCTTKAKNDNIKQYYKQRVRIKNNDTNMWKDLVYDIEIDATMQVAPKVLDDTQENHRAGAIKRKSIDQLGPVGLTPNSTERNQKGRRQQQQNRDLGTVQNTNPNWREDSDDDMPDHMTAKGDEERETASLSVTRLPPSKTP